LRTLYLELKPVVDRLALGFEGIRYYAYSVIRFQIPQVSRRSAEDRHLHLISFIVYQTFKLQDILIDTLLSAVQAALNATEKEHKESYYQERERRDRSVSEFIDGLRHGILGTLSAIKTIVVEERLTDEQKVAAIDAALNTQEPRKDIVEQRLDDFERNVAALHQGRDYYALLEDQSLKLQNRVAEIVRQARFDAQCRKPALWEAIRHYQQKAGAVDKNAPMAFLSAEQRAAVGGQDGKFRVSSLYKALLYIEIAAAIKPGLVVSSDQNTDPALRVPGHLGRNLRRPAARQQPEDLKMRPLDRVLFFPIPLIQLIGVKMVNQINLASHLR
jgi:hypothetical protein